MFDRDKDLVRPSGAQYRGEHHGELLSFVFYLPHIILEEQFSILQNLINNRINEEDRKEIEMHFKKQLSPPSKMCHFNMNLNIYMYLCYNVHILHGSKCLIFVRLCFI